MTKGPENRFITSVHAKLPKEVYRMKNHNPYLGGVPDCWYSGVAGDLWIEYKWGKGKLSALQAKWVNDRRAEGRRVWIVTAHKSGVQLSTELYTILTTKEDLIQRILGVVIGSKAVSASSKRNKQSVQNSRNRPAHI